MYPKPHYLGTGELYARHLADDLVAFLQYQFEEKSCKDTLGSIKAGVCLGRDDWGYRCKVDDDRGAVVLAEYEKTIR